MAENTTKVEGTPESQHSNNAVLSAVDYSYSGIVNRVQNDAKKGIEELKTVIENIWAVDNEIERLQRKLNEAKTYKGYYMSGVENLRQHLKLKYPIGLLMNGVAVEIDDLQQIRVVQLVNGT